MGKGDYWLYIALLGAVIAIWSFVRTAKAPKTSDVSELATENMEMALEDFMRNMERENTELVTLVKRVQEERRLEAEYYEKRLTNLERKLEEGGQVQQLLQRLQSPDVYATMASEKSTQPVTKASTSDPLVVEEQLTQAKPQSKPLIHERYAELFSLYDKGKSIDAIARHLHMNKGEVQLIIQLSRQEGTNEA